MKKISMFKLFEKCFTCLFDSSCRIFSFLSNDLSHINPAIILGLHIIVIIALSDLFSLL